MLVIPHSSNMFVFKESAISLIDIRTVRINTSGKNFGCVLYKDGIEISISNEMANALLIELSRVTVTKQGK